jgi:acyl carrier protein
MSDYLQEFARLVRSDRLVSDADVLSGPEPCTITVLVVPRGYRPGPVLRQRIMKLAGDAAHADGTVGPGGRMQVALVPNVPRDKRGLLDQSKAIVMIRRPGALYLFEPPATETERSLAALVREVLPGVQVSMTDGLTPLGGDSLTAVELLGLIHERLGVELDPQLLYSAETIRDLATVITQAAQAGQAK